MKVHGVSFFLRENIKSLNQVKSLIKKIRKVSRDTKFPILIDEEGQTVSRLREIINHNVSQNLFGDIYKYNPKIAIKIYKNYINKLSGLLKDLGININTIPVLDVLREKTHKIIGVRSYSNNQNIVKKLGKYMC